jgi:hypothetical protein
MNLPPNFDPENYVNLDPIYDQGKDPLNAFMGPELLRGENISGLSGSIREHGYAVIALSLRHNNGREATFPVYRRIGEVG